MDLEIVPIPPSEFCKRLHEFEPGLELNWDRGHGVWSIWYRNPSTGERSHVMNVIENDGSYRPLDGRVFQILTMNRYYAANPDIAFKKIVTIEEDQAREKKFVHDELKHLAQDKSLQAHWQKIRDMAGSVSWKDWRRKHKLHDNKGNVLRGADGKPIYYRPHVSLTEKP